MAAPSLLGRLLVCSLLLVLLIAGAAGQRAAAASRRRRQGILAMPVDLMQPDVVVAKDGSGDCDTVSAAVVRAPPPPPDNGTAAAAMRRFVIHVKAGSYDEQVIVTSHDVLLVGDGAGITVITGHRCNATGDDTESSATLITILGHRFMARDLTVENSAGGQRDGQAVALRTESRESVYYRCEFRGYQDTLYAVRYSQFYRECNISGTVDFVFGDATAVFQNSFLLARRPADAGQPVIITAQGRQDRITSGFVFQNCTVSERAGENLKEVKTYLGRPWKSRSTVVFMLCAIDELVHPDGYFTWRNGDNESSRIFYREYQNHGLGADATRRVQWKGFRVLKNKSAAIKFTPGVFLNNAVHWLPETGVPHYLGLTD